ncbi:MAG: hypothetical protein OXU20_04515 [Myxococcales bacterium]|nr:hypothetical protein [Myxococcales bacterium]
MSAQLLTGNNAAAWGARLSDVEYIPAFPITPQTEIIENLAAWVDADELAAKLTTFESEHSMVTAAGAAAATGVRVFTATSSQGLLYAMEMIYTVAGWRVPLVMVNVSRGVSAPITLEPDHCDVLAARDSGFLQLHAATCQEVLDLTLIAFRVAEDARVRLPVIVNQDGFYLSFTREPVRIPDAEAARKFVGPFDPRSLRFHAQQPMSHAVAVLGGSAYSYFRYEAHMAVNNGLAAFQDACSRFGQCFGREYSVCEAYRLDGAEIAFVMLGSFATKAKAVVDELRRAGQRVGLLRPRVLRPFPEELMQRALAGMQAVIVVDQNLSMGKGGVLHTELASALYALPQRPVLLSFVGGLGGRDITEAEFVEMVHEARRTVARGTPPPPRLLYTEGELRELRKLQAIAAVQHEQHPEQERPDGD